MTQEVDVNTLSPRIVRPTKLPAQLALHASSTRAAHEATMIAQYATARGRGTTLRTHIMVSFVLCMNSFYTTKDGVAEGPGHIKFNSAWGPLN